MSAQTILLIDYEPRSVRKIRQPLEDAGYRVAVAQDGPAGIEAFNKIKPDLTLVEAMLPKRHGFEVCKELKQTAHGASSPVWILTSVYKGRKYRQQAKHIYRCDLFLEKPIRDEDLLSAIRSCLGDGAQPEPPTVEVVEPPTADPTDEVHVIDAAEDEISTYLDSLLS